MRCPLPRAPLAADSRPTGMCHPRHPQIPTQSLESGLQGPRGSADSRLGPRHRSLWEQLGEDPDTADGRSHAPPGAHTEVQPCCPKAQSCDAQGHKTSGQKWGEHHSLWECDRAVEPEHKQVRVTGTVWAQPQPPGLQEPRQGGGRALLCAICPFLGVSEVPSSS